MREHPPQQRLFGLHLDDRFDLRVDHFVWGRSFGGIHGESRSKLNELPRVVITRPRLS